MSSLERARRLSALRQGSIEIRGRMPWSSNGTFLVGVTANDDSGSDETFDAVYKPLRGERPLWDFPDGLYRREVAAYELSEALGWDVVPETVVRLDGPLGEGSLQRFVPSDFSQHYFTILESDGHRLALQTITVLDLVANNTDRKAGHLLLGDDGRVYAIDNALCFHPDPKVRTVMWDFAGEPIPANLTADLARVAAAGLPSSLTDLLHDAEIEALEGRLARVSALAHFPEPVGSHPYPWPLV